LFGLAYNCPIHCFHTHPISLRTIPVNRKYQSCRNRLCRPLYLYLSSNPVEGRTQICPFHRGSMNYVERRNNNKVTLQPPPDWRYSTMKNYLNIILNSVVLQWKVSIIIIIIINVQNMIYLSSNPVEGRTQICPFHRGSMNYAHSLIHLSDINLFFEQIFTEVEIYIVLNINRRLSICLMV
jgi:hypothetical protein